MAGNALWAYTVIAATTAYSSTAHSPRLQPKGVDRDHILIAKGIETKGPRCPGGKDAQWGHRHVRHQWEERRMGGGGGGAFMFGEEGGRHGEHVVQCGNMGTYTWGREGGRNRPDIGVRGPQGL